MYNIREHHQAIRNSILQDAMSIEGTVCDLLNEYIDRYKIENSYSSTQKFLDEISYCLFEDLSENQKKILTRFFSTNTTLLFLNIYLLKIRKNHKLYKLCISNLSIVYEIIEECRVSHSEDYFNKSSYDENFEMLTIIFLNSK